MTRRLLLLAEDRIPNGVITRLCTTGLLSKNDASVVTKVECNEIWNQHSIRIIITMDLSSLRSISYGRMRGLGLLLPYLLQIIFKIINMDNNSLIDMKGIASHASSCPFMFVLFPSMLVPIMRPLELKSCQSNQGVAAIWDTPPKSISVKRAQITQIFNYQVACRQENRVYDFDCAISLLCINVHPFQLERHISWQETGKLAGKVL